MESASRLAIVSAFLAILSATAFAKTPSAFADLVGATRAGGETQLGQRAYGYEWVQDDHATQYCCNAGEQACTSPLVDEGRLKTITGRAAAKSPD